MENITIRPARLEDASEILKIYEPYIKKTTITFEYEVPSLDASARGLADGDRVEIFSPFGGPVKANLEVSILVPPGTIDAQYGWKGEEDTQRLVPRQWDPLSGYAPYFEVNVEVRKVGSQK